MKYKIYRLWFLFLGMLILNACQQPVKQIDANTRPLADTIGFAQYDWQMDSIMDRINRLEDQRPELAVQHYKGTPKVVISPHDDYAYVDGLYPAALSNIRAKTIILFGVAHKARLLNLQDQIVFDSYNHWKGPYGTIRVSNIREDIIENLPHQLFQVNDSMQRMEHSVEAIIPFLQYYNRNVEIVSILVPYMSFEKMEEIADPLAQAIKKATLDKGMKWGEDFAFVISTDAVHYGDEDWGNSDFAFFGTDSAGYTQAIAHEHEIMDTLSGKLNPGKVKTFCDFTVDKNDFKKYKWTWCGRYSVPLGLLTTYELNELAGNEPLIGTKIGYANSIDHPALEVKDLGMGVTAPAKMKHWVGYATLGYK
ncbi:MAG: AmmeMemoRadiSam system protein B [Bacteroidetes bacterium]|nr:AmmeMemoRadiSam system protein B [Bacteroidota bacterium]